MTDPRARTFVLAVGLLAVGGLVVFLSPRSATVVLQRVVGGLAVIAALHVVASNAPAVLWSSPFDRGPEPEPDPDVDEAEWIRARLAGRRVRLGDDGAALPPETLRLLRPLIEEHLTRGSSASHSGAAAARRRSRLSPLTRAVLAADATMQPGWWTTVRPDEHAVAELVHHVLDDLERNS